MNHETTPSENKEIDCTSKCVRAVFMFGRWRSGRWKNKKLVAKNN